MKRNEAHAGGAMGRHRPVKDRWISELVRVANNPPSSGERVHSTGTAATPPAAEMRDRLRQAIGWGYQEREFAAYEQSLARRATLGEFLTWARARSGCLPDQLAERTQLSAEQIRSLEEDRISALQIAPERLARLTHALGTSIWMVLERIRPEATPMGVPVAVRMESRAVWSDEALQVREPFRPVKRTYATTAPKARDAWSDYCQALYRAWQGEQDRG